ncbi:MAG: sulfatase-like hydrolase/transferase [Pseudomonadota bacterium]
MSERPNILWFCTDQQRWDTIAALGHPGVSTPAIDRLVGQGVAFERAYVQSPICTPSRASFLTGRYPSNVRVTRNGNAFFPPGPELVTKLLADAGYACGLVGKLHLSSAYQRVEARTDDGYETFLYSHAPRDDWREGHAYAAWVRAKGGDLGALARDPDGVPAELHQTTWACEQTITYVERMAGRPWLASVNVYDPHPPFNPPAAYRGQFDPAAMPAPLWRESDRAQQTKLAALDFQSKVADPRALDIKHPILPASPSHGLATEDASPGARDAWTLKAAYYAMIKLIDDQFARVVGALEATGQLERTVILFTSDHGEMLGDHGLIEKGCRFYEGLVRVPMIWSMPGRFRVGARSDALVMAMDVAPTLLELAGLDVPKAMQGRSLLSLLEGRAPLDRHHDFVRAEYLDALDLPGGTRSTMYFDGRHKLSVYHNHGLGELYDLERDPGEFDDLWDASASQGLKLDLLRRSFDATVLAQDEGPPRIGPM